ncbi:MAG: hypothetical protein ACLQVI_08730 [Polyangiaceae bacterium]
MSSPSSRASSGGGSFVIGRVVVRVVGFGGGQPDLTRAGVRGARCPVDFIRSRGLEPGTCELGSDDRANA